MTKRVLMHVDPNGVTKIEAEGYEGGSCQDATRPFEQMFTKTVVSRVTVGACGPSPDMGERVR